MATKLKLEQPPKVALHLTQAEFDALQPFADEAGVSVAQLMKAIALRWAMEMGADVSPHHPTMNCPSWWGKQTAGFVQFVSRPFYHGKTGVEESDATRIAELERALVTMTESRDSWRDAFNRLDEAVDGLEARTGERLNMEYPDDEGGCDS